VRLTHSSTKVIRRSPIAEARDDEWICVMHCNAITCEKFITAQFHHLGIFGAKFLLLTGLVLRKTAAQYDGRRSNNFPSAPF
jgi:hypothetical protein